MHNIGSSLDHTLKSRAQTLHANSAQLSKQEKEVAKATDGLRKETDKLKKVADEGTRKVKELGNVQNWAEMLERDFLLLEETLRLVKNGNRPREGGSGDYEGSDWETSGSEDYGSGSRSWSGSEDGERDDESIAGDLRRGKVLPEELGLGREQPRGEKGRPDVNEVDGEGDTPMDDVERPDKGKGKEVEVSTEQHPQEQHAEQDAHQQQDPQMDVGGSSTATGTEISSTDHSSASLHTLSTTS